MKCGLLGRKLGHSYSPQIHAYLGDYSYELFEKEPNEIGDFLKNGDFTAINVTIPYKKDVIPFCDELSPRAIAMGAVNTIVRRPDGSLIGHNTDHFGFSSMVERCGLKPAGKKVLVLGSGGASNTAVRVMAEMGANVVIISRRGENNYSNLYLHTDASIIVNATPVGMYPDIDGASVDLSRFPNLVSFVDVVYNPLRTRMYQQAKSIKKQCCCGLAMLVGQAVYAARHFSEKEIDNLAIERTLSKLLPSRTNIVLTGMPGCGKSTIGKLLSEKLDRKVYDSDELIVKNAGMSIPEIFEKYNEAHFRELEAQAISELSKMNGIIISTGGGAVMREENRLSLSQNGRVYFIKRELEHLARGGRPLSTGLDALREMYAKREPVYTGLADVIVDNNGQIEQSAQRIWSEFI